jgi:hypothetical protein
MQRMPIGMVNVLIFGLLTTATVAPTTGWSQMSVSLQQVEQQWREEQRSTEMHRQQMERITDPAQLAVETRRHFQMTEELLARSRHRFAPSCGSRRTPRC